MKLNRFGLTSRDMNELAAKLFPPMKPTLTHEELRQREILAAPFAIKTIRKILRVTGGSKEWHGETADFLRDCEAVVEVMDGPTPERSSIF